MVHGRLSTLGQVLLWLTGRRRCFRVVGHSMAPALAPGDHILVDARAYRARLPRPGEVIVVRHPYRRDQWLVKRVAAVGPGARLAVTGDNAAASTDSRTLGTIPADLVLGRLTSRLVTGRDPVGNERQTGRAGEEAITGSS